jgi:hypothetical protein
LFALMNWTDVHKVILAMQLSYALSYYYDGRWLSGRWQQANIRFFRWGPRIPCKPWLRVSLSNQSPQETPEPLFHRFPQMLELGTILLELHIGQSLESFLGVEPARGFDEQWAYATKIFYDKLNSGLFILSRHYRRAIEFCLRPDFGQLTPNKALKEPNLVRESIYENVVLPLEQAIVESKLDEEALEALDLGSIKRTILSNPNPPEPSKPTQKTVQAPPPVDTAYAKIEVAIPQPDEELATGELEEGFDLFGEEDGLQPDKELVLLHTFLTYRF